MGVSRGGENRFGNALDILHHIIVPHSHHLESSLFQQSIAHCVVCALFIVLPTIDFHNQMHFKTNKIHDELLEWKLPAKAQTFKLSIAHDRPEFSLGIGHRRAELTRALALYRSQPHVFTPTPAPLKGKGAPRSE